MARLLTAEKEQWVGDQYQGGKEMDFLATELKVSVGTIQNTLKRIGVPRRLLCPGLSNPDQIVKWFEEGKKQDWICEQVQVCQKTLRKFLKKLGIDPGRGRGEKIGALMYGIYVGSSKMCQDLNKYGCVRRKSYFGWFPSTDFVPASLMKHYLRGLIDGDGTITGFARGFYTNVSLFGNLAICEGARDVFQNLLGVTSSVLLAKTGPTGHETYRWSISAKDKITKVLHWLYDDCEICLDRKFERAKFHCSVFGVKLRLKQNV